MNYAKNFSKRAVYLFVILAFLFLASVEQGEAFNCPSNYFAQTILYPIPGTNCVATVEVCYQCTPTFSGNIQFGTISIYDCNERQAAWGILNSNNRHDLMEYVLLNINYNGCTPTPCNQGGKQFVVRFSACNIYKNVVENGINIVSKLIPCESDQAYCEKTYNVCWNGTNMEVSLTGSYLIVTPNCSNTQPNIGTYPYNWDQSWETYCFTTGCN